MLPQLENKGQQQNKKKQKKKTTGYLFCSYIVFAIFGQNGIFNTIKSNFDKSSYIIHKFSVTSEAHKKY